MTRENFNADTNHFMIFSAHTGLCVFESIVEDLEMRKKIREAIRMAEEETRYKVMKEVKEMVAEW